MKIEYKIIKNFKVSDESLNTLGQEGWQLIVVEYGAGMNRAIFKRIIIEEFFKIKGDKLTLAVSRAKKKK